MALALAATAIANPSTSQYEDTVTRTGDPSSLALTGLDAVSFAATGLALILVGFVIRRLKRSES